MNSCCGIPAGDVSSCGVCGAPVRHIGGEYGPPDAQKWNTVWEEHECPYGHITVYERENGEETIHA